MVLFSVVITSHNRCGYLRQTLEYFEDYLSKTNTSFEILVVDGFSTDNTNLYLSSFSSITQIPFYFLNASCNSPASKRNYGLNAANGEWIIFLDDDCVPIGAYVDDFLKSIQDSSFSTNTIHSGQIFYPSNLVFSSNFFRYRQSRHPIISNRYSHNLPGNQLATMSFCISKEFVMQHGLYFDESFVFYGEDIVFGQALLRAGGTIKLAPASVIHNETTPNVLFWYNKLTSLSKQPTTYQHIYNIARTQINSRILSNFFIFALKNPFLNYFSSWASRCICRLLLSLLFYTDSLRFLYFPALFLLVERLIIVINSPASKSLNLHVLRDAGRRV